MKVLRVFSVGLVSTLAASIAVAEFSGAANVTSDYDYRGIAQTATDPALQGSLVFQHDNGFYASVWGSSLDWGDGSDADIELDYTAGFSREIGTSGVNWDAGLLYYHYPGLSAANFLEFYGGFSYASIIVKLSYSDDFAGVGESGWYLNAAWSHGWENGWNVLVYGGYSFGDAFDDNQGHEGPAIGFPDYINYGIGAGYTWNKLYFELKGVGTDLSAPHRVNDNVFANDFRAVFSLTLALP
jgi:uncharacterized protein (TIGR02001 family)